METKDLKKLQIKIKKDLTKKKQNDKIIIDNKKGEIKMKYEIKGKKINIPDQEIEKSMKLLDITQDQAIEMYLCDHDYIKNEEVENLTKKAKNSGADKIINRKVIKKSGETTRKPKENPLKEQIIANLHNFLLQNSDFVNIIVTNKSKSIDFYVNDKYFTLNLVEHRPPKQ